MALIDPTVADFKAYFTRDFPYGATPETVNDSDIQRAIDEAVLTVSSCAQTTQAFYTLCMEYFIAHILVMNIRASSQGLAGQYDWLVNSKGVGNVSEGLAIPQRILDNPMFSMLSKTPYGVKYLQLILPCLTGVMFSVKGGTRA